MTVLSIGAVMLTACVALLGLGIAAGLLWILWRGMRGVLWLLGRVLGFVKSEVVDTIHAVGALVTGLATVPLVAMNLTIFRLGAAKHYARAIGDELKSVGAGLWRVALGNPLRLVGLGGLVDGIDRRLPDVVQRAPRGTRARRATFEGYDVIGTLPSGGSGAQLFVARPRPATLKRFLGAGRTLPGEVVIKSFALEAGSTLPQIVRESRALEAASRLGLVCEHQLTNDHFYYVMPYVKGEDLDRVIRTLHARGSADGLGENELGLVLGYASDLLEALQRFHSGGLWHKDVKPANIIVANGRAHLVDFGLVTPLASAMTLTTHGTEYYRDPEMVRLALQGVKVHEVDGVRFDIYSAGAVLFSLIENSFPAHGSLSRITKRCPDALRWIVQRAMAELSTRYGSAQEMRADLNALAAATSPFELRPADLPSFQRASAAPQPAYGPASAATAESSFLPSFARVSERPRRAAFEAATAAPAAFAPVARRRGVPAIACAAAGLFGLFFLTTSALFFAGHRRAQAHQRFAARPESVPVRFGRESESTPRTGPTTALTRNLTTQLSSRDRELLELAQGVAEDLGGGSEVASGAGEVLAGLTSEADVGPSAPERDSHPEGGAAEASPTPAPGAGLPSRGRVLVLDDLTTSVDARVVARLRKKLGERGFSVVGQETQDEDAAAAVELIAAARNALGLGRADEPETQVALQRFLDQSSDLAALILVSRSEQETEHLYRVFVRERDAGPGTPGSAGDGPR